MKNLNIKTNKLKPLFLFTTAVLAKLHRIAYAQSDVPNDLGPVFDFIFRGLNLLVYMSGAVFLIMLFVSGYKYSLSQGDPKGLQGAKDTLTLAVVGFIIVIGVFVFIRILIGAFGLNIALLDPATALRNAVTQFVTMINDCNQGGIGCVDYPGN